MEGLWVRFRLSQETRESNRAVVLTLGGLLGRVQTDEVSVFDPSGCRVQGRELVRQRREKGTAEHRLDLAET